ncbi:MAG TPA: nucleotidyltransferase domain-containing protein [Bacteroidia bacterium]|nr:nucleotidyltransferase domain-containing protein [Bacteroidia bacterium]
MRNEKPVIAASDKQNFSESEYGILNTLLYFDIFKYPLTKEEIEKYCHSKTYSSNEINEGLDVLVSKKFIKYSSGFYFVNDDYSIVERRINGNLLAEKFNSIAKKYSRIISKFPFVRAVFISGSLSKGYMDKESDIDYFIITAPGRLWLSRTLLVLFKKIFLLNSHKYFCVNYFIDENNLEIPDKNIFTAMELVTLVPMINDGLFKKFLGANTWTGNFFPNVDSLKNKIKEKKRNFPGKSPSDSFKFYSEKIFSGSIGNKLDDFCLKITLKFWKKKFLHFSEEDFKNALRSKKDVSKHHPNKFQEKVLGLYVEKINQFEKKHLVSLSPKETIPALLNEVNTSLFQ